MFRTDSKLPPWVDRTLPLLFFVLAIAGYLWGSYVLHQQVHPVVSPKLMPTPAELWEAFQSAALMPDPNGTYLLWADLAASLTRFATAMVILAISANMVGLSMIYPFFRRLWFDALTAWEKLQPILLLPIIFLVFSTGEAAKLALIIIAIFPGMALDAYTRASEMPKDLFYKAQTLGASELEIATSVVLPQIFPKMIGTLRRYLNPAYGLVMVGEMTTASVGIGYRIFVVRRYMDMATIIDYVVVAMIVIIAIDYLFQRIEKLYPWADK